MRTGFTLLVFLEWVVWVSAQSINVVGYPLLGTKGVVEGYTDAAPTGFKIAIVDDVFGTYWSKPYDYAPSVSIRPDGTFTAVFDTGGQDVCAGKIYLFLVPRDAAVPVVVGGTVIPAELTKMAAASYVVNRAEPTTAFTWAGRTWMKKDTGTCVWGPGPNYYSPDAISVDAQGRLHMVLSYTNGTWRCPEIISKESFGFGFYRFAVDPFPNNLPDPIVVGWFIYDEGAPPFYREVDIEHSNGAVVGKDAPWQYVIQPFNVSGQRHRFNAPTNRLSAIHTFLWAPGIIAFASFDSPTSFGAIRAVYDIRFREGLGLEWTWSQLFGNGPIGMDLPGARIFHLENGSFWSASGFFLARLTGIGINAGPPPFESWSTTSGVPTPGKEKVHVSMWLLDGKPPGPVTNSYEVVVSGFDFTPLDPASLQPTLQILNLFSDRSLGTKLDLQMTVPGSARQGSQRPASF